MSGTLRVALRAAGRAGGPLRAAACRPMATSGPAAVARGSASTAGIIVIGDEILKVRPGLRGWGGLGDLSVRPGQCRRHGRLSVPPSGLHAGHKLLLHVPAAACSRRARRPHLGGAR